MRDFISQRARGSNFYDETNRYDPFGFQTLVDRPGIVSEDPITRLIIETSWKSPDCTGVEMKEHWNFGRDTFTRRSTIY